MVISYNINYYSGAPGIGKHWLSFVAYIGDNILEAARACNPL
jgi:hypothetical protein